MSKCKLNMEEEDKVFMIGIVFMFIVFALLFFSAILEGYEL